MQFDHERLDAGCILEGVTLEISFSFRNVGDMPLQITNVPTNTGAAVASYPLAPIPPGGTGVIKVKFLTTGRFGAIQKNVHVKSNDSLRPVAVLEYKAVVLHKPGLPSFVAEGDRPGPSAGSKEDAPVIRGKTCILLPDMCQENVALSLRQGKPLVFRYSMCACGEPFLITQAHKSSEDMAVQWDDGPQRAGESDSILVWLNRKVPGPFSETVILETDSDCVPMLYLHAEGVVEDR